MNKAPTRYDVGRFVDYTSNDGRVERGVISSIHLDSYIRKTHVYVKFKGPLGELCRIEQLLWVKEGPHKTITEPNK